MSDEMKAAKGEPKADVRDAFAWEKALGDELNAKHEGQFRNFGDAGARVLNGWAQQWEGVWVLTSKGQSLTEADYRAGVDRFLGLKLGGTGGGLVVNRTK